MTDNTQHPVSFEEFEAIYQQHLADPDRPTAYVAYCRAEAEMVSGFGRRRWANHKTFSNTMSRRNSRQRQAPPPEKEPRNDATAKIRCHLCDTVLYTVPRGDLRTIIPHFCTECRSELRKLILI